MRDMPMSEIQKELLRKNFSQYLIVENGEEYFKFDVGDTCKNLKLTSVNTEKICLALSVGRHIGSCDKFHVEHNIGEFFADGAYIYPQNGESIYLGIVENKILDGELKKTVTLALDQSYNKYITSLIHNGEKFLPFSEDKPRNFAVTVNVFKTEVFLSSAYNYQNYCDDSIFTAEERLEKYGFVSLTAFVNIESIKRGSNSLLAEFKEFFEGKVKSKYLSFIHPILLNFVGYAQKDAEDCIDNIQITTRVKNLDTIPLYNHNPSSKINNPRDISEEPNEKFTKEVFTSFVFSYKKYIDSKTKKTNGYISKGEAYRSLGAKQREVIYNTNQTMVILDETTRKIEERKSQVTNYYTCDMSLVDGQHSTRQYYDTYNYFKNNTKNTIDVSYQSIIKEYFGNLHSFDYDGFLDFLIDYPIIISLKGFSDMSLAEQAAKNQNNIRKQTRADVLNNMYKERTLTIATHCNGFNSLYKIFTPKSSFSNPKLRGDKIKPIPGSLFVNVWAFFNVDFMDTFIKKQDNMNKFVSSNSAISTLNSVNYSKALDWYIVKNEPVLNVIKYLGNLNDCLNDLMSDNDQLDQLDEEGIFKKIKNIKIELEYLIDEDKYLKENKFINKKIYGLLARFDDVNEDEYVNLTPKVVSTMIELDQLQALNNMHVDKAFKIISAFKDYSEINKNKFKFLAQGKNNGELYLLNIFCLYLRMKLKDKEGSKAIMFVDDQLIAETLALMDKNLSIVEQYINDNNIDKKDLFIGSNQHDIRADVKKLMFNFVEDNSPIKDIININVGNKDCVTQ